MKLKSAVLGAVAASSMITILAGCGTAATTSDSPTNGTIMRKLIVQESDATNYQVWVKYNSADDSDIVKYPVREDYYKSCEIGDKFDSQYAIGEGITEVDVRI